MVPPSPLTPRSTASIPFGGPFESLIRAAGLPEMCQALTHSTDKALHKLCTTPPFMAFVDECSRSCRGHMWRRIFPAWMMMTNTHTELVPRSLPLALNPLQISGFHVLYTHTRVSIRHVCRFYQMRCYPSASLVPAPSSLVLLSGCPLSLSVSLGHTVISVGPSVHRRYSGSGPGRPRPRCSSPSPSFPSLPSPLLLNH
jgi:hypothetical protein